MKKGVVLIIVFSMICISMSGAAVTVKNPVNENIEPINEKSMINQPTESPEVNVQVLKDINQEVDKYLNFGEYNTLETHRTEPRDIKYPWHSDTLGLGDFVDWIIHVNYQEVGQEEKHFQQEVHIIDPEQLKNFKTKFLWNPWHYEAFFFDTNEDGINDLDVYYSVFISQLTNLDKGIDAKSIKTCLKVSTADMLVRDAKLEVWSEIKLNYGLIKETSRSYERSTFLKTRFGKTLYTIIEGIKEKMENSKFTLLKNIINKISAKFNDNHETPDNPEVTVMANDYDSLALGIGLTSPLGETMPISYEKYFNVAKENIFSPICFEQELHQITSKEPLGLLFGFKSYKAGSQNPSLDVALEIDFDPCIDVRTQFIPLDGYIYYYYDTESGNSQETRVTFTTNGFLENVELSLTFDNTNPLAGTANWMSFDVKFLGFDYKANKKHTVSVLLTSPSFSGKLKLGGIPKRVSCGFDVDLSFIYQQGQLLDVSGSGSFNVDMDSTLDNVILYYPELSSNEPQIELFKVNSISSTELSVGANLYVQNSTYTTIRGGGYARLAMSGNLGKIQVFYRKADPNDPDRLFVNIPNGIPAFQEIGAQAELYINLNNFSAIDNYVYGKLYRTASGDIPEISGYLPGYSTPIVRLTEIPAHVNVYGKLEWNKLKGYAHASRQQAGGLDPVEVNIDIGTFSIYNKLTIRDGNIDLGFYLNKNGYFKFGTTENMFGNTFAVEDTSSGNILGLDVDEVSADDLDVEWALDMNQTPIPIEKLKVSGVIDTLKNFAVDATLQGKNLNFEGNWKFAQEGLFSVDFHQGEPINLTIADLFPDNPTWDIGGGVIISEDFHFDIKWNWVQGEQWGEVGYFKINEDTNDPNFDWMGVNIQYTPEGYTTPQYGIQVGGTNIGLIVYMEWWKHPTQWIPQVWWYIYLMGNFYLHLLWKGTWYPNVDEW